MKTSKRKRASSTATRKRLDGYPFADWLAQCLRPVPDGEDELWLEAEHGVDFHVDVATFRTELHNLAKRETGRRFAARNGEGLGVQAKTSQVGVPEGDLAFRFEEAPFDECPAFPRPGHHRGSNREAVQSARAQNLEDGFCRLTLPVHTRGKPPTFNADCPCAKPETFTGTNVVVQMQAAEDMVDVPNEDRTDDPLPSAPDEYRHDPIPGADATLGLEVAVVDDTSIAGASGRGEANLIPGPAQGQPGDFQEWLRQQALQKGGGQGGQ